MAEMWVESFADISEDVFIDACKLHREGSLWFPTIKEVLERCKDVWAARQREQKLLSEPIPNLTQEQVEANIAKIREIVRGNLGKTKGGMT